MKPAQLIQVEKKVLEVAISEAVSKFAEATGGAVLRIDVQFVDVQAHGDEYKKTAIGKIDVKYLL